MLFHNCECPKYDIFKCLAKKSELPAFMQLKISFSVDVAQILMENSSIALNKLVARLNFSR